MTILSNILAPSPLITEAGTQTLLNKTLTNPTINGFTGNTAVINIGSGQIYKDTSGNVGIGTSSPGAKLQVGDGSASTQSLVVGSSSGTGGGAYTAVKNGSAFIFALGNKSNLLGGAYDASPTIYYTTTCAWFDGTASAERMRIDSSGNVGIGTSSPQKKFSVSNAGAVGLEINPLGRSGEAATSLLSYNRSTSAFVPAQYDASEHQFLTSTTERMRLDSSGNLGLGVTPSAWGFGGNLELPATNNISFQGSGNLLFNAFYSVSSGNYLYKTTAGASRYQSTAGTHVWYTAPSGTAGNAISFTQSMTLDAAGNLLVGKTAIANTSVGNELRADGQMFTTLASSTNSFSTLNVYSTGASAYRFYVQLDGKVNATNTTIAAISDIRLKENIQDIDVGLNHIMSLKPRKFDWKEGKGKNIKGDRGWIAQEFEQVFPEMIGTWKDEPPEGEEPYKSVAADLIPVLVKAIQEQQALIESLTARVAQLEGN